MRLSQAIQGFLLFKQGEGLSRNTINTYQLHLRYLEAYCNDMEVSEVTSTDILRFLKHMRTKHEPKRWNGSTKPLSAQTIRNIWVALRSFFTWASYTLQIVDVMQQVPVPKASNAERTPFKAEEVKRLLKVVTPKRAQRKRYKNHYIQMLRDQAIILLLLDTGLRANELCQLDVGDVSLTTGKVSVQGKGDKHRNVYLADLSKRALWQYLAERETKADAPLLLTTNNRRLSRYWLRRLLAQIGERAGVEEVYPHRFRYTFAIQYLRNGGDIFTLQMLLGHSSLKMVRYYAKLADVDASSTHSFASPVDRWLK